MRPFSQGDDNRPSARRLHATALAAATAFCLAAGLVLAFQNTGAPIASPAGGLNPNTATAASLERLPGIGPARAAAIIDYRRNLQAGGKWQAFKRLEDLQKVKGIGPKTAGALAGLLVFQDESGEARR
jgi:competence ComEA-like helix-hairpin-helix protein